MSNPEKQEQVVYDVRLLTVERKVEDHDRTLYRAGTGGAATMASEAYNEIHKADGINARIVKLENAALKMATYGGIALFVGGTAATLAGGWLKKVLGI